MAPTGTVKVNNNAASTTSLASTLSLAARDAGGVAKVRISNSSGSSSGQVYTWPSGATSWKKSWTLGGSKSSSGTRAVYVWFYDRTGNRSLQYRDTISYKVPNKAPYLKFPVAWIDGSTYDCRASAGCWAFVLDNVVDPDGDALDLYGVGIPTNGGSALIDTYPFAGPRQGEQAIHFYGSGVSGNLSSMSFNVSDGHGHQITGKLEIRNL